MFPAADQGRARGSRTFSHCTSRRRWTDAVYLCTPRPPSPLLLRPPLQGGATDQHSMVPGYSPGSARYRMPQLPTATLAVGRCCFAALGAVLLPFRSLSAQDLPCESKDLCPRLSHERSLLQSDVGNALLRRCLAPQFPSLEQEVGQVPGSCHRSRDPWQPLPGKPERKAPEGKKGVASKSSRAPVTDEASVIGLGSNLSCLILSARMPSRASSLGAMFK